jgi:hypothetical protein
MRDPEAVPGLFPGARRRPWASSPAVDWITSITRRDRTVLAAVPAGFARYATVVIPAEDDAKTKADAALVEVLEGQSGKQQWWLGFLDTGAADVVNDDAPRVPLYADWPYVLMQGGPQQALTSRSNSSSTPWHSALPELLFPADRSWLVSTMWDDDWRCVGGTSKLIDVLLQRPELEARSVLPGEDPTPPGHHYG